MRAPTWMCTCTHSQTKGQHKHKPASKITRSAHYHTVVQIRYATFSTKEFLRKFILDDMCHPFIYDFFSVI